MSAFESGVLRVAIAGAGCSGALLATHLLRQDQRVHVDLVDSRLPGRGLAYSTAWDEHLLNVRAGRMSAFGSEPGHFLDWLHRNGHPKANGDSFVPRKVFGAYLQDILQGALISARELQHRVRHHGCHAVRISQDGIRPALVLENGDRIPADRIVLAIGNPPSRPIETAGRYFNSPWEKNALADLDPNATVLLLGSGLTAVDAFLALEAHGHRGTIHCLSRRGKLPHVHTVYRALPAEMTPAASRNARQFMANLRQRVKQAEEQGYDWRAVVDSLRPASNDIWEEFGPRERARVMRHLKTLWDIHRHRMAPEIGAKVEGALTRGQLQVIAGRLRRVTPEGRRLRAEIVLRSQTAESLMVDRLINCTGSDEDYRRSPNALVASLLEDGFARCGAGGKGLLTDGHGALIDSNAVPSDWLFTLGPPRTGGLIETTAVPEVRIQAEALAYHLVAKAYEPPKYDVDYFMAAGI